MNTTKYNHAAYRQAVWKEAARLLRECYFPEEGLVPQIISDQVFRVPKEVPSEIIQEVLLALHKAEASDDKLMMKFGLEEKTDEEIRDLTKEEVTQAPSVKARPPAQKAKPPTKGRSRKP